MASAGEFNKVTKTEDKPYGLVALLRSCFPNPSDFESQLKERFGKGHKEATEKRVARIRHALEVLIQETLDSKDISTDIPFQMLLKLPIAENFRKSIAVDDKEVVLSGLAWDWQIYLDFINILKHNFNKLGEKPSQGIKSFSCEFIEAVVWPALQARSSLCDLEVFGNFKTRIQQRRIH